jgi:hypothetical protein
MPNPRICPKGHKYFKTSECPTCPVCEAAKARASVGFLASLGAPAYRALKNAGLVTLQKLSKISEKELLALHGVGPASLPVLRAALKAEGLAFNEEKKSAETATKKQPAKTAPKPMKMKNIEADTPDEYVAAVTGWRHAVVMSLRRAVRAAARLDETLKWGHLVYQKNGPVLLIRAEDARVLFGFWRGKSLRDIEPRLKPGGKYEMATLELREGDKAPSAATVKKLVRAAVALNAKNGNPQAAR